MGKRECVVVVGGGAAGMMAALSARRSHPQMKVILIDHEQKLGRKLLVCGAGRCNVTNVNVHAGRFSGASLEFVDTVLKQFGHRDVVAFLEDLGIPLYEEKKNQKGKLFPVTNQAQTVLGLLVDELERECVEIRLGVHVEGARREGEGFTIKTNKGPIRGTHLILASGGKTFPKLGGDGSGYAIAEGFRHAVVEPVPTALPLVAPNPISKSLHGVRAEMEVAAIIAGVEVRRDSDQMMFVKYGFTGPAILNVSRPISLRINREKKRDCELELKFLPRKTEEEIRAELDRRWARRPEQRLSMSLYGIMERKLPPVILGHLKIADRPVRLVPAREKDALIAFLSAWRVPVEDTRGWDEGEFTAGGVDSAEIDPGNLRSKIVPGLYFAGEILDVDGDVGGFNLTWAWASGFVAGRLG